MICSRCGSTQFYKNGHKPDGRQRWQCKICGREQVEKPSSDLNSGETYFYSGLSRTREGSCGSPLTSGLDGETQEREMACLETVRTDLLKDFPTEELRGKILQFLIKRKGDGIKDIRNAVSSLKSLARNGADLYNPEAVKKVLAEMPLEDSTKKLYVKHYEAFLKFLGGTWQKPRYYAKQKIPYIPLETLLDQLIAALPRKTACFCQILKETGARPGEIGSLKWRDVDLERRIIYINEPEKGSLPRVKNISEKLVNMLNTVPRTHENIFGSKQTIMRLYYKQRKNTVYKLGDARVLSISLKTFRHWKGTTEYLKSLDIFHVKNVLGHKRVSSTEFYIHIAEAISPLSHEYNSKVATTIQDACALIESGYEYVCDFPDGKIFRKRK